MGGADVVCIQDRRRGPAGGAAHRGVGGGSLLAMLTRRMPGDLDNPLRQNLFRAMHAHAGVWVLLALVGMLDVDQAQLSDGLRCWCTRRCSRRQCWSGWAAPCQCVAQGAAAGRADRAGLPRRAVAGGRGGDPRHRPAQSLTHRRDLGDLRLRTLTTKDAVLLVEATIAADRTAGWPPPGTTPVPPLPSVDQRRPRPRQLARLPHLVHTT